MKVLELFAGSRSFGRVAEKRGHDVFSIDWTDYEGIDLIMDIEKLNASHIPWIPDYIHASPDCTTYTIAAISTHRNGVQPKTEYAAKCDRVNKNVLMLIQAFRFQNSKLQFTIENPRGMLRKMPFMQGLKRDTIWYCQYGDNRAKPTDIFYHVPKWVPRAVCFNGNRNCHHEPAKRGSKTGTQGRRNPYERSKIPADLCIEIIQAVEYGL